MELINDLDNMSESTLRKLIELVHVHTGITMSSSKKALLRGRIRPRLIELGLPSYRSYVELVRTDKNERQEFINLVTTHETSFFRTQRVWDYFSNNFLPTWYKNNSAKTLRIWSGASSTGEEVYTIAICCEEFKLNHPEFNYQILGTDISSDVINRSSAGKYSGRSIDSFKRNDKLLFDKYMLPNDEGYSVISSLKSKVRFSLHNLFTSPRIGRYDIIFLRNVLIYFSRTDQEKVLEHISGALNDSGILVLGESESLNGLRTTLQFQLPLIYKNKF